MSAEAWKADTRVKHAAKARPCRLLATTVVASNALQWDHARNLDSRSSARPALSKLQRGRS